MHVHSFRCRCLFPVPIAQIGSYAIATLLRKAQAILLRDHLLAYPINRVTRFSFSEGFHQHR